MLGSLLLLAGFAMPQDPVDPRVHHGRLSQHQVRPPRLEGVVTVNGVLDEPMWNQAAILTGFSQFTPVDGVAATDSTEILVWYSATSLHIGVRAYDSIAPARATLTQRDRIFSDDNVQLFLSTFNDGRQATFLAVNPLGVQADGVLNESGRGGGCSGFNCSVNTRESADLSQDFVWQSVGRVTEHGYDVEIVVPLKSIRFQSRAMQTWGINVLRTVQRSGQEQSWMPARLGASSFLTQSGHLVDLTQLRAGRVIDVVPTLTSRVSGTPGAGSESWNYDGGKPEIGGHVRWGVTPNLTLNATANPDFAEVEADATQFTFDPRQALFFAERRPFFLDGIEQFQVPNNLVYTRRVVQPVVATKLTGRIAGTRIGVIAAVDDKVASRHGENPLFGVLRLVRDIGSGSQIGMLLTEQHDGEDASRVIDVDGRLVMGGVHSLTFSGAMARDQVGDQVTTAPLWALGYRLNGRAFRARYSVSGIHEDFRTRSGFISRPGVANAVVSHSYTWLRPEKALESITGEVLVNGTWQYHNLVHGGGIQDGKLHFNLNTQWKGGWTAGVSLLEEYFGYDEGLYANYGILQPNGDVTPFVGVPRIYNRDFVLSMESPAFTHFQFNAFALVGKDENFFEWASGDLIIANAGVTVRPTEQLRLDLSYNHTQVNRPSDGSRVSLQVSPRARVEYQLSRALQVRIISQYSLEIQDSLRDNSRTELPIAVLSGGQYQRALGFRDGRLRTDLLVSYLPNPGTVIYLGYGTSHTEPEVDDRRQLTRQNDAFFLKLSYLFRMQG